MAKIEIWRTNETEAKLSSYNGNISAENCSNETDIVIHPEKEYQEIIGFGGAFNEVGWEAIKCLNEDAKNSLMKELFTKEGCNFTLCRTPIGASDFALDAYSLNDVRNDFAMENFSIERDKKSLIPYIKEAMKNNPDIKIWSCPWSPPYWMKTTDDMCNGGELIDTPENLRAYADYFVKYLNAYENEGIKIYAFAVQNEIDVINVYPTSTMTAEMMRKFVRAYLIPALVRYGKNPLKSQLWLGTIRDVPGYADVVVNDAVIKQFASALGFQYSSAEVVNHSYENSTNMKIVHTESPCHNGANSWEEAKEIFKDIIMYLRSGCSNYCYWNMVLNETKLSTWDWAQNSVVTVNRQTKEVTFNPEFYVMKHFSSYIMPGAKRVESISADNESSIAFKNPDGSLICVLSNFEAASKKINIKIGNETIMQVIEPGSIYTIRIC